MLVLVSNVGSTSLKFRLYDMPEERELCNGKIERIGAVNDSIFSFTNNLNGYRISDIRNIPDYSTGINDFLSCLMDESSKLISDKKDIKIIGFKTVAAKGYNGVFELDDKVIEAQRDYLSVAPAHNTAYIESINCFKEIFPDSYFIGSFETGFHTTIPSYRRIYSAPYEWYEKYGIQKLGYHGASHYYVSTKLNELLGESYKAVSCHLGGSCSLCAIEDGKSVDTSFGMSLQIGMPQSNRVGDFDPYIIRYLEGEGLSEDEIFEALTKKSGLLGVSGISKDLRYIMEKVDTDKRAKLAVDMFVDSVVGYIGSYSAKMGGIDALVFTAGIGENSRELRKAICEHFDYLGLKLSEKNEEKLSEPVNLISTPDSRVKVYVIPANEEIVIARKTYEYLVEKIGQ